VTSALKAREYISSKTCIGSSCRYIQSWVQLTPLAQRLTNKAFVQVQKLIAPCSSGNGTWATEFPPQPQRNDLGQ